MTITSQQLAELNTNLSNARSQQADLQARARLIREAVREGRVFETSEVNNNDLVRRLLEQRANLKAQIAFDERTLLPGHPRMKELGSQLADLETQVRAAAERAARALENDSRAAGARVASLQAELDRLKRSAALSNEDEVQLKALERDATALREQLNSYRIRFLDAAARTSDSVQPADARIISRAFPQSEPTFPKKIPIVLLATLGTLVVASALVASQHLMSRQLEFALAGYGDMPAYAAPEPARSGGLLSFVRRAPAEQPDAPDLPGMDPGEGLVLPSRLTRATGNATAALAQQLANELAQMGYLGRGKVLLVLAADPRGRASNTALRFGRAMAGESGAVLVGLAGAPDFYQRLLPPGAVGFGAFLDRVAGLGETIHADARSPLHLVPPGHPLIGRLLSGEASLDIRQAIEAMARGYGLVLIDGGPAGGPGESLADLADAVLLSVRPGFEDAQAVADRLEPVLDGPVYLVDEAGGGERQAANDSYPSAREA